MHGIVTTSMFTHSNYSQERIIKNARGEGEGARIAHAFD